MRINKNNPIPKGLHLKRAIFHMKPNIHGYIVYASSPSYPDYAHYLISDSLDGGHPNVVAQYQKLGNVAWNLDAGGKLHYGDITILKDNTFLNNF